MEDKTTNVWEPAETRRPYHRGPRTGGLIWATLLIGAGIILLLNNLGLLGWGVWIDIARLWPVFLIAAGVGIIFGRRAWLGGGLAALLVALALGGGVLLYLVAPTSTFGSVTGGQNIQTRDINQQLEGATSANVNIDVPVALLKIGSSSDSNTLISGKIAVFENENIRTNYSVNAGQGDFRIGADQGGNFVFPLDWFDNRSDPAKEWNLNINRNIPITLSLNTGVGKSTVDLSNLKVTDLRVNTGVGESEVTLPRTGQVQANIQRGVGNVIVRIPDGMAANINVDGGLGNTDVANSFNRLGDNHYQSPNYDTATNKISINVNGGVGNFTVESFQGE